MIPGIKDIKVGDKQILKVYTDNKLVWENTKPVEYSVILYDDASLKSRPEKGRLNKLFKISELKKHGKKYDIKVHTKAGKNLGVPMTLEKLVIGEKQSTLDGEIFKFNDVVLENVRLPGGIGIDGLGAEVTYSIRFTGVENHIYKDKAGYLVFVKN